MSEITCKVVSTIPEFVDAIRLRVDVFIKEQKCEPGWEPDEQDRSATHYVAILDGEIVGTARVVESSPREYKIERMVTKGDARGRGIGKALVAFILKNIGLSATRIWMQSQVRAQGFYESCGFRAISDPYDLWGIEHLDMEYSLAV